MPKITIEIVKTGLDGVDAGGYQGSVYYEDIMEEGKHIHPRLAYIAEALAWEEEYRRKFINQGHSVSSFFSTRGEFGGPLEEVKARWEAKGIVDGEHPVDTEWRETLAEIHPLKHEPNRTL